MSGDKLVFEVEGRRFGIATEEVASIAESEKLTFIPGQSSFVVGVISLRGEPVAVVDARKAFTPDGAEPIGGGRVPPGRIVIAGDDTRSLGFYIGASKPYFIWGEDLVDFTERETNERFLSTVMETGDNPIEIIDWTSLFDEAARLLATG